MKKLTTYNLFTEGVKDLMTPKPEEEIRKTLESKPPKDKVSFGVMKDIPWLVIQGLEESRDIDVTADDNYLIKWASEKRHLPLVKLLIERGADIHAEDDISLRKACFFGYIDIVKYLIEKGANVNADRGYVLSLPAQKGYYEIVELLLNAGSNKKIDYAIRLAKDNHFDNIVELLKKHMIVNEGVRDMMTGKSLEDIKKDLSKVDQGELLGRLSDMDMKLTDVYSEEEILELEPDVLLEYSFYNNYVKGIKYVLDNYRLYGKDTKFTISCHMPDIKNDDDVADLLKNEQIRKFLNSDQLYILEKYRAGMHQSEIREYEKKLIEQLDKTDYYQSKSDPVVMIGKNKRGDKNYFNYNKNSKKLIYHLDNLSSWLTDIDDEDSYESHRGNKDNEYGLHSRYINIIMKGVLGKYYGIKIDKADGSRNDEFSFVKD